MAEAPVTELKAPLTTPEEWAARIAAYCDACGVTGAEKKIVILHCQGVPDRQIQEAAGIKRGSDFVEKRARALHTVSAVPGFWDAACQFPADLVFCAEDRRVYDERAAGVTGVTPAREGQRFQGGRIVTRDTEAIRQDVFQAARLFGLALRGPEPAAAT